MVQVSEPERDLSVLSEAPEVLADMLSLLEANDKFSLLRDGEDRLAE
jgi:hypothetical protein